VATARWQLIWRRNAWLLQRFTPRRTASDSNICNIVYSSYSSKNSSIVAIVVVVVVILLHVTYIICREK
jgi:hypothetical protein